MPAEPASDDGFLHAADELLERNTEYAATFDDVGPGGRPRRRLAIVACMDSRMDIFEMLGLAHGEAR